MSRRDSTGLVSFVLVAFLSSCGGGSADLDTNLGATSVAVRAARPVDAAKELLITDPTVIASVEETTFDPRHPSGTTPGGAWSFGRLVHNMLPRAQRDDRGAASQWVMSWLKTWETDQAPNASVSPARARSGIRQAVINPWKAASGCASPEEPSTDEACVLDLAKAPFRLIAIVNRPDLRIISEDQSAIGGEGRFVFQLQGPTLGVSATTGALEVMDATVEAQKLTVIFEYSLPVSHAAEALQWAERWHRLGDHAFGPAFNAQLRKITNDFSGPDQDRRRPNGNALNQIRTNEVALFGARFPSPGFVAAKQFWELREFRLASSGLVQHPVNQEPSRDFDLRRAGQVATEGLRTPELVSFLLANGPAVLVGTHQFGALGANASLVGSAPYGAWGKQVNPNPPSIPSQGVPHELAEVPIDVRDAFALSTCAGCHRHETDTRHFMHVTAVGAMEPADKVDDRARIGVPPDASEDAIVLSNFLRAELSTGGGRYEDFTALLASTPAQVQNALGPRVCAE